MWKNVYEFAKWYFKNEIQLIDKIIIFINLNKSNANFQIVSLKRIILQIYPIKSAFNAQLICTMWIQTVQSCCFPIESIGISVKSVLSHQVAVMLGNSSLFESILFFVAMFTYLFGKKREKKHLIVRIIKLLKNLAKFI